MRSPRLRRPSPALVIAVLALAIALAGSAYAVGRISGTTIKPHSIPGDRIRDNALTGAQINEARLGRVNEAKNASNSKFALRASAAASADNALNAADARNADALGGSPPGAYQERARWALIDKTGVVLDQSGAIRSPVTHAGGTGSYVIDFGASLARTALLVTLNGAGAATGAGGAAPCGGSSPGALPGAVACTPAAVNDGNHARVQLPAEGAFYIVVLG